MNLLKFSRHTFSCVATTLLVLVVISVAAASSASASSSAAGITALAQRVFPEIPKALLPFEFQLESEAHTDEHAVVSITNDDHLLIVGSTPSVTSAAFYHFLKRYANMQVTLGRGRSGYQTAWPKTWPRWKIPQSVLSGNKSYTFRPAMPRRMAVMNPCSFGYSNAFYGAEEWKAEIDVFALHGFNSMLAPTGQEYVALRMWQQLFNLTLADLNAFFVGKPFEPWNRLSNIRGYGGPADPNELPAILKQQFDLQVNSILPHVRALGIAPVLSCFSGAVPAALASSGKYPAAWFSRLSNWNFFGKNESEVTFLDPTTPLYHLAGAEYVRRIRSVFGGDNDTSTEQLFACDLWNEVFPANGSTAYLRAASGAVVAAMKAGMAIADKKPTKTVRWCMQTWLWSKRFWFWWSQERVRAFLEGPGVKEALLLLDLHAEMDPLARFFDGNFFGTQWVFGVLLDYGGRRGLMGNLTSLASAPLHDRAANPEKSTQVGFALTPEATHNNPVAFELFEDIMFAPSGSGIPVAPWLKQYVNQRYAGAAAAGQAMLQAAWAQQLSGRNGPYNQNTNPTSGIEHTPSLYWSYSLESHANFCGNNVHAAADLFLQVLEMGKGNSSLTFNYDAIDIVRQSVDIFFADLNAAVTAAMRRDTAMAPATALGAAFDRMEKIILALDELFSADVNFMLGPYLRLADAYANDTAKTAANREQMRRLAQLNARRLVTVWGNRGPIQLSDYASRAWSGMYRDYYFPRWKRFFSLLKSSATVAEFERKHLLWQVTEMMPLDEKFVHTFSTSSYPVEPRPELLLPMASQLLRNLTSIASFEKFYHVQPGSTVPPEQRLALLGGNGAAWSTDPARLGEICRLLGESCLGFDSNGFFMSKTSTVKRESGENSSVPRFCDPLETPKLWLKRK